MVGTTSSHYKVFEKIGQGGGSDLLLSLVFPSNCSQEPRG